MKKFLINIYLIIAVYIIYFLQANFFNWFTIAQVMPNLFVIFVLFVGLFGNKLMGTIYGMAIGLILDLLFSNNIGVSFITLGLVGFTATIFDRNFSKDSRLTIMLMVAGLTIFYEVIFYFVNYFITLGNLEIMSFIKILIIEVIYNVILTIILYPLMQKFGYTIENEFKGNKILTRYF